MYGIVIYSSAVKRTVTNIAIRVNSLLVTQCCMWENYFDDFSERFPCGSIDGSLLNLLGYWILNKLLLLLIFCDKTMCQKVALAIFSAVVLLLADTAKSNNSTSSQENACKYS